MQEGIKLSLKQEFFLEVLKSVIQNVNISDEACESIKSPESQQLLRELLQDFLINYGKESFLLNDVVKKKTADGHVQFFCDMQLRNGNSSNEHGYAYENIILEPNLNQVISITPQNGLKEYVLPSAMKDDGLDGFDFPSIEIQDYLMLYCGFIIKPNLGKKNFGYSLGRNTTYLLRVKNATNAVVTVSIRMEGNAWHFDSFKRDEITYAKGAVVLYFETENS